MDDGVTILGIVAAFVACQATMGGGLVHVVKKLLTRSDLALESRDKEVVALLAVVQQQAEDLRKAIQAFSDFEKEEEEVHDRIVGTQRDILARLEAQHALLSGIGTSLERTAQLQERMLDRLNSKAT